MIAKLIGLAGRVIIGRETLIFSKADGSVMDGSLSDVDLGPVLPDEDGSDVTLVEYPGEPEKLGVGCDGKCLQFTKVTKNVTDFSLSLDAP